MKTRTIHPGYPTCAPFPFFALLESANPCLAGVKSFHFYPGMLFGSREKWWPGSGLRPTSHEGTDICYYTDRSGTDLQFTAGIRIPAMASGRLFTTCRDFLGRSLFIDHCAEEPSRFLSVYAHVVPIQGLMVGQQVEAGEVIGSVADTAGRKNRMPAHVHLSLMEIPRTVAPDTLDWNFICNSETVRLVDPLSLICSEAVRLHTENPWKQNKQATF
jgi:murein DD-endopeptidase MepM/ murein hydrolase activator NlpD